jgi:Tfp pilus assembly protein PilO
MVRTIFALLGVGGAVALFLLYTKPAYDSVEALKAENESYDLALEKAAELQRLKQSLLSRYNAFSPADIERLHKLLPDHVDNVRLILDLVQNVAVSRPGERSEENGSVIGPSRQQYDSVTLTFATQATYDQFQTFLLDLEDSLRIVDLLELSIDGAGVPEGGGDVVYNFSITLRTYTPFCGTGVTARSSKRKT